MTAAETPEQENDYRFISGINILVMVDQQQSNEE